MNKLWLAVKVLRKGEELQHAATWKTVGAATAALTVVLPDAFNALCVWANVCLNLSAVQIDGLAGAIANVGVGLFVLYTILGTSKKVGV